MDFLVSPWFGTVSLLSILTMIVLLWGALRACHRHNTSAIACLYNERACFPSVGTLIVAIVYVLLTIFYVFAPPIFHHLLL